MDDVEIWLIRLWVWIIGDTRPHKEALKSLKCRWHSTLTCWYWKLYDDRAFYSKQSLGTLASLYGAARLMDEGEKAII